LRSSRQVPSDPLTAALRMLARRPYSVAELRRALERKFPEAAPVRQAITRLRELGYLDDRKFAEQYAYSLAQNHALGPHRVRRELKAKLVNYQYIEPAVEQTFQNVNEHELLERTIEKKLRSLRLPVTRTRLATLCQSLMRRGFRASDIIKAVRARPELRPVAEEVETADLETEQEKEREG
jgi:regulatory protein